MFYWIWSLERGRTQGSSGETTASLPRASVCRRSLGSPCRSEGAFKRKHQPLELLLKVPFLILSHLCTGIGYKVGPRLHESRLLTPSGHRGEWVQTTLGPLFSRSLLVNISFFSVFGPQAKSFFKPILILLNWVPEQILASAWRPCRCSWGGPCRSGTPRISPPRSCRSWRSSVENNGQTGLKFDWKYCWFEQKTDNLSDLMSQNFLSQFKFYLGLVDSSWLLDSN